MNDQISEPSGPSASSPSPEQKSATQSEIPERQSDTYSALELDRVIDVPLAVTLRFGQRKMRLREVAELNAGSLIELDRQVEEPVDLMLGEAVIARGDVVIVDGNYGIRVTEIVQMGPVYAAQA